MTPTALTFGLDLSHYQPANLDLARARREGIEFVFIKATDGAHFVDPEFSANLVKARKARMLVAAYHYVRANASAAAQVWGNVARVVPTDVPVIPDVEAGSGGLPLLHEVVSQLRRAGYRVPLVYLPRWYWQHLGSPPLAGLPPLWSSRYPDNVAGSLNDEYADVPAHYWNGYGGLDVAVLQFTSSVRIAGHQPIDCNAFRGTRAELAQLLGADVPAAANVPATPNVEDHPMRFVRGDSTAPIPDSPHTWGDVVFKVVWPECGPTAVRTRVADPNDPGFQAALKTGTGMDPATKQPWVLPQTVVDAIPDAQTELDVNVDLDPVVEYFEQHPPVAAVSADQVAEIAKAAALATVAEFKREGN